MTNAPAATAADDTSNHISRIARQLSGPLCATAGSAVAGGMAVGFARYLDRSPVKGAHVSGTSAWVQHLIVLAVAVALYGVAKWRHNRRFGRGSGRLLLLAPLGRSAAARVLATLRQVSWRAAAMLPLIAVIAFGIWRAGEQITAGLDPNFTVNAWGGPTYLGAMACHYVDAGLGIAVCAWLLDKILVPAVSGRSSGAQLPAASVTTARTRD